MIGANNRALRNLQVFDLLGLSREFDLGCLKVSKKNTRSFETCLKTRSGLEVPVEVYLRNIPGATPQMQWILRDISERRDLDQLREDLIAMVYHDLRSPLSNVVSSLEVLNGMVFEDQTIDSLLKIALRSTERVQRLTNSLLDINRLEAGQKICNQRKTTVMHLIDYCVATARFTIQNKQIKICVDVPADLPEVWVDEDMIRRMSS